MEAIDSNLNYSERTQGEEDPAYDMHTIRRVPEKISGVGEFSHE